MIDTLAELGVDAHRAPGRIGIWVGEGADERKIGALGVRVKRWVTLHGFALNVAPDLTHFGGIVPCGIAEFGVTSLAELGKQIPLRRVDAALKRSFPVISQGFASPDAKSLDGASRFRLLSAAICGTGDRCRSQ